MGSQPREVDQETNSATMLRTILALALVAVVKSQGDISQRMMRQIAEYNFRSACWGQENMDNSLLALWRNKRAAAPAEGFLKATEADLVDFLIDYQEWGENFVTSIGNMSCVSQEMGLLTDDLEINMEHYTNWDDVEGFD